MTEVNFNRYLTRGPPITVLETKKSEKSKKKNPKSPKIKEKVRKNPKDEKIKIQNERNPFVPDKNSLLAGVHIKIRSPRMRTFLYQFE